MLLQSKDDFVITEKKHCLRAVMVQDALMEDAGVSGTLDEMEQISLNEKTFEKRRLRPLTHFLDFDISKRPTQAQDRVSKVRVYTGIAAGVFLIVLGLASNISFTDTTPLISAETQAAASQEGGFSASWLFVALGLFLIVTRLLLLFYGRDFFIGQKFAAVVIQKPFERSNRMADSLTGYIGVRYRSRIVNVLGLTSYTQHIIDLQHPNEAKTIPLYITNNGNGISEKWRVLAEQLDMPAVFNTADGIVEIPLEDIEKPLPVLIAENKVSIDSSNLYKLPSSFKIIETDKSCEIEPQIRDSAFSKFSAVLCVFAFFLTAGFALIAASNPQQHSFSIVFVAILAAVLLILIPVSLFFRKRRIIISKDGICIKSRWIFFPSFGFLIKPDSLESFYVVHNSYDLKYSLVIGADGQTTHIGKGLPKSDLDWLRNYMNFQLKHFCKK